MLHRIHSLQWSQLETDYILCVCVCGVFKLAAIRRREFIRSYIQIYWFWLIFFCTYSNFLQCIQSNRLMIHENIWQCVMILLTPLMSLRFRSPLQPRSEHSHSIDHTGTNIGFFFSRESDPFDHEQTCWMPGEICCDYVGIIHFPVVLEHLSHTHFIHCSTLDSFFHRTSRVHSTWNTLFACRNRLFTMC